MPGFAAMLLSWLRPLCVDALCQPLDTRPQICAAAVHHPNMEVLVGLWTLQEVVT